jgi:c-Rel proto-oncogene protein
MFKNNNIPYVKIVEEPMSRGARFRYECEGRYSGSILGVNSTTSKKSYPSIEVILLFN